MALTFVFEYILPQSVYYCDSVVTMLEDALTDRDLVHRQTASVIVEHIALGVAGMGCEDSMMHLMNLVWPNCFEMSPHVIGAVWMRSRQCGYVLALVFFGAMCFKVYSPAAQSL
jgi:splicing factor 3B subunit 1